MSTLIKTLTASRPVEYVVAIAAALLFAVPFIKISLTLRGLPTADQLSMYTGPAINPLYHAPTVALIFTTIALVLIFLLSRNLLHQN